MPPRRRTVLLRGTCHIYKGAKSNIYCDPKDNQKTRVHDFNEDEDLHTIHYLGGIPFIENIQNAPFGLIPGLPPNIASPQSSPSPDSMPELESISSDNNNVSEPDEVPLLPGLGHGLRTSIT